MIGRMLRFTKLAWKRSPSSTLSASNTLDVAMVVYISGSAAV
jgi:hypothetical protein